jgi:hypothetical protein
MHADRTNRAALTLFGLLVFLAGGAGLAGSVGLFGNPLQRKPLLHNTVSDWIGRHGSWLWALAAVAALLLLLFTLRWLLILIVSTDRAGDITVPGDKKLGATNIRPDALTTALTTEIETYRGVDTAKARILGDPTDPELVVAVTLAQTADLAELRHRIQTEALTHARQALGNPYLPIQLDLDVSRYALQRAT